VVTRLELGDIIFTIVIKTTGWSIKFLNRAKKWIRERGGNAKGNENAFYFFFSHFLFVCWLCSLFFSPSKHFFKSLQPAYLLTLVIITTIIIRKYKIIKVIRFHREFIFMFYEIRNLRLSEHETCHRMLHVKFTSHTFTV